MIVALPKESVHLYFTQDDREIEVDSRVIQVNDSLRYEVFLNSFQLGFLSAILGHHSLLIKLMSQISILIKIQGTSPCEDKWGRVLVAS